MSWNILSKKEINQKNYETLYMRILQIGYGKLENGLSFNELVRTLEEDGFVIYGNSCVYRSVMHWFVTSFHHMELQGHSTADLEYNLGKHLECNFILNGGACSTYIAYTNMLESKVISEHGRNWAAAAAIVTALSIFVSLYIFRKSETDEILDKSLKLQTELLNIQTKILELETNKFEDVRVSKANNHSNKKDTLKVNNKSTRKSSASR